MDFNYAAINIGIGSGIAADAMLATLARARALKNFADALRWSTAIGLTHWLFPMVGFLGGWYLATNAAAKAVVYGSGGALLVCYVFHVLRDRSKAASDHETEHVSVSMSFWLAVWGVSIDALITGPGKAAATAHWTTTQVLLSFPFVGAVVFALVLLSTVPAIGLHRRIISREMKSWRPLAIFFVGATWTEVLIFTWFSILSIVEACGAMSLLTPSYSLVSGLTGVTGTVMIAVAASSVWRAQSSAARRMWQVHNSAPF